MDIHGILTRFSETGKAAKAVFVFRTENYADPNKPWNQIAPQESTVDIPCVFLQAKHVKYGLSTDEQYDDDAVASTERRILVAADSLGREPTLRCSIRANDVEWRIVSIIPIAPSGKALAYIFQVRR